jgi:predicted flap endonuclease-1-like 5' DNA nuclease
MPIESLMIVAPPVVAKGTAMSMPAAQSALAAKHAAALMADVLLRGSVAAKTWLAASGATPAAAAFVLPGAATYGTGAASTTAIPAAATTTIPAAATATTTSGKMLVLPSGLRMIDVGAAFQSALQDGTLTLTEVSNIVGTAAQGTPLQATITTVQSAASSLQSIIAPLAAGLLGGGAAHAGLNHRQQKRTKNQLGAVLAAFTAQENETAQLRAQVTATTARVAEVEAVLTGQSAAPEAPAESPAEAPPTSPPAGDPLEVIKGIGPVFMRRLNEAGIYTFSDLAATTPEAVQAIVAPDRASHMFDIEDWIEQARKYAAGEEPPPEA